MRSEFFSFSFFLIIVPRESWNLTSLDLFLLEREAWFFAASRGSQLSAVPRTRPSQFGINTDDWELTCWIYRRILCGRRVGRESRAFVLLKPRNICGNANFIFHTRPAGYMVPSYLKICIMVPWHVYVHTSPSPPLARSPWARCSRVRAVNVRMRFVQSTRGRNITRHEC